MKIELKNITVREVVEGYMDKAEEGVRGYGGELNLRPAYQRELIYKDKQRYSHRALAQGRKVRTQELPDALHALQPDQGRGVTHRA